MSGQVPDSGLYQSALQKYIRRGEVSDAVAVARALIDLGKADALSRRLTAVVPEDVGWSHLPDVRKSLADPALRDEPLRLLDLTAALASVPKDKEAYWLAATVWENRHAARDITAGALRAALRDGQYRDALAILFAAKEAHVLVGLTGFLHVLEELALPRAAREIVDAAIWAIGRRGGTGRGLDEVLAAAVIAGIDRPTEPARLTPGTPWSVVEPRVRWYCCDGHTGVGRHAATSLGKKLALDPEMISNLQFDFESVRLGPTEIPARWKEQARSLDALAYGWDTDEHGAELWQVIGPQMEGIIKYLMERDDR